jgi:sn-glycerol 3-phosphate transport system substrate-binding protein
MLKLSMKLLVVVALLAVALNTATQTRAQKVVEINFYYPTAVGGPITKVMDGYAAKFMAANPDIKVNAVYAGGYADIYKAVDTQIKGGGKGPDVAIFLTTDLYSLIDNDYITPVDDYIKADKDGEAYLKDFFPAFMLNSQAYSKTWAAPFQRSTPVLYYNKDMFKEAGLNPDKGPQSFDELVAFGKKLTKADGSRWGLEIPSDGFPYWLFQGFAIANGQNLVGDAPNKVFFNTPSTVDALTYFRDLSLKEKIMPTGVIVWGNAPTDFTAGKAAMIYHTTGSLTNILRNAKFEVGVSFLPAGKKGFGAPTGGGNLYILKSAPKENQDASWKWIKFLTSPEIQADWTINTGYIAARQSAWEQTPLKELVAKNPQYAVARDQLKFADKELATHRGSDVQKIFGTAVQKVITGELDPKAALDAAQKSAEDLLKDFKD